MNGVKLSSLVLGSCRIIEITLQNKTRMNISTVTKNFGPWHRRVFISLFYVSTVGLWQNYSIVFFTLNPTYRCIEPDFGTNATCYVSNGSTVLPCTKWEYEGPRSIIREWDLVCDREWLVSLSKSVYMVGFMLSVFIFGQLSDIFGRFPTSCVGYTIAAVSSFLILLSSSYTMFLVLRFFQAFGRMGFHVITYVLMLELAGVKHRTAVGIGLQSSWALGACILPGVAYVFQDWFSLELAIAIAFLPFVLAYAFRILPESPRWLLMKGKQKELSKTLKKIAAINNLELTVEMMGTSTEAAEEINEKSSTIFDLLKTPKLRKKILILYYLWGVVSFMYYALLFNTNDLAGDLYLNFFISSALEFVSQFAVFTGSRIIGRRLTLAVLTLGSAATCVARIAVPQDLEWLQICFWMVGKFFVTGSFATLYVYSSELFPTAVRNVAVGSCSTAARLMSVLAPFVKELGKATFDWVPTVIYGSLCLVGGFLALLLPETKDQEMTDTLEEEDQV